MENLENEKIVNKFGENLSKFLKKKLKECWKNIGTFEQNMSKVHEILM